MDAKSIDHFLARVLTEAIGESPPSSTADASEVPEVYDSGDADSGDADSGDADSGDADSGDSDSGGSDSRLERIVSEEEEVRNSNLRDLQKIIRNGKYYYPAASHYPNSTEIFCDRCNRGKLRACIGWDNADLCLSCASVIEMSIFYNGGQL